MNKNVLDDVASLYDDSFDKYGRNPKGVGWTDENKHQLRFDKLFELVKKNNDFSINDLGCGYGSLYSYLLSKGKNITAYVGYEISPQMCKASNDALNNRDCTIKMASKIDTNSDYSIASGIFNVRFEEPNNVWLQYIHDTLDNMNNYSDKGFAFNLLTSYVDWKEDHLFYADPCYFFDYCKLNFSKRVVLLHDYDLWEWTILVNK